MDSHTHHTVALDLFVFSTVCILRVRTCTYVFEMLKYCCIDLYTLSHLSYTWRVGRSWISTILILNPCPCYEFVPIYQIINTQHWFIYIVLFNQCRRYGLGYIYIYICKTINTGCIDWFTISHLSTTHVSIFHLSIVLVSFDVF